MPSSLHQQFAGLRFDRRSSTENRQISLTRLKKMHSRKGLLPTHKPMTLPENQTVELKFDIDHQNWAERLLVGGESAARDDRQGQLAYSDSRWIVSACRGDFQRY